MLGWMVGDKHIAPHVPVWDKTGRNDDSLSSGAFQWNVQANEYTCPQGYALRSDRRQVQDPSRARHQGRHRHLSVEPARLRGVLAEEQVLPQTRQRAKFSPANADRPFNRGRFSAAF
jgi:hypothetical protein